MTVVVATALAAGLSWSAPSVGAASRAKAAISSFTASPANLSYKGGKVELAGKVSHAAHCTITSSRAVSGLPKTVACRGGTVRLGVRLPRNVKASALSFTFTLKASRSRGSTAKRAATAREAAAPPTAGSLVVTPSSTSYGGGSVTLSDTVSRASRCTFSSLPALSSLPVTKSCSSGKVSTQAKLPAGTSEVIYHVTLKVTGPGGTVTRHATAERRAPAPAVGPVETSPTSVGASGGTVHLSTPVTNATSCTYSVAPALSGFPKKVACSSGNATASATIPSNSSPSEVDYTFSLSATGSGGTTASSSPGTLVEAPHFPVRWSAGAPVEPAPVGYGLVSCPTTSFCAAGDQAAGNVITWQGSAWGTTTTLPVAAEANLASLSCSSASLCVTSDGTTVWEYNGSSWSAVSGLSFSAPTNNVSCLTGSCAVFDSNGNAETTTNGSSWSKVSAQLPGSDVIEFATCVAANNCLAIVDDLSTNNVEKLYSWNGTSWASGIAWPTGIGPAQSLSCSSTTLCISLYIDPNTGQYGAAVYNGSSWAMSNLPAGDQFGAGMTCLIGGDCWGDVYDSNLGNEYVFDYNGSTWSEVSNSIGAPGGALSCLSNTFCGSVSGNVGAVFDGSSWAQSTIGWAFTVTAISCVSGSFCMAGDNSGNYSVYNGSSWSSAAPFAAGTVQGISCWDAAGCEAVDSSGYLYYWNGTTWAQSSTTISGSGSPGAVACTSSGFCVAVEGEYATTVDASSNGTGWSTPQTPDTVGQDLTGVSCTSSTFCMAVDANGDAFGYDGSSWSSPTSIDTNNFGAGSLSISCLVESGSNICVAAGDDGYAEIYRSGSWSTPDLLAGGSGITSVSCNSTGGFCLLTTPTGLYYAEKISGTFKLNTYEQAVGPLGVQWVIGSCSNSNCLLVSTENTAKYGT